MTVMNSNIFFSLMQIEREYLKNMSDNEHVKLVESEKSTTD